MLARVCLYFKCKHLKKINGFIIKAFCHVEHFREGIFLCVRFVSAYYFPFTCNLWELFPSMNLKITFFVTYLLKTCMHIHCFTHKKILVKEMFYFFH